MNRINELFSRKKKNVLNIYYTAGFPQLADTLPILESLQAAGADMVEIGIPFSDSLADGPVIQESNQQALKNGMAMKVLFDQIKDIRQTINIPVILMGSLNPVIQFGIEHFLATCKQTGIDGVILPDLPIAEYEKRYKDLFVNHDVHAIFLVTPETSDKRLKEIDALSRGFIYAVSSSSTTGTEQDLKKQEDYFKRLQQSGLQSPVLVGFGIKDKITFDAACQHTNGAIIGTAFIRALQGDGSIKELVSSFIGKIKGQ